MQYRAAIGMFHATLSARSVNKLNHVGKLRDSKHLVILDNTYWIYKLKSICSGLLGYYIILILINYARYT